MDLEPRDRIIVALDVNSLEEAMRLVKTLQGHATYFKVGLEAIYSFDFRELITYIHSTNCKVFLDVKLHDIPNTVTGAAKAIVELGVEMFNIHASAGIKAMTKISELKGASALIAVTVLTSHNEAESFSIFGDTPKHKVIQFAFDALVGGCNGIVCSPHEIETIRKLPELDRLSLIVPGIRPKWRAKDDQERIMTPGEAIKLGADMIVIGRPITQSEDPVAIFEKIVTDIESTLL